MYDLTVQQLKTLYVLQDSVLMTAKTLRPVKTLLNGQHFVMYKRKRIPAGVVAWCLLYGYWPTYKRVRFADSNHENYTIQNLQQVKRHLRPLIVCKGGDFSHTLAPEDFFPTEQDALEDWRLHAAVFYARQHRELLAVEQQDRIIPVDWGLSDSDRLALARETHVRPGPKKPGYVQGRVWHWFGKEWVSVPVACHVASDYVVRCLAVLAGKESFEFDAETQIVV